MELTMLLSGLNIRIKSIQTGQININATTNTASINAVDLDNSLLFHLGQATTSNYYSSGLSYVKLDNSTTVRATRKYDDATTYVRYAVVEFYPHTFKSIQRGLITSWVAETGTYTISAVDTTKSILMHLGQISGVDAQPDAHAQLATIELSDSETITGTLGDYLTAPPTVSFQIAEVF